LATKERFWNVDLRVLASLWLDQLWVFFMTFLTFVGFSLPVVIPALILWYLYSTNWSMSR
jgi:hypothetical protein